MGLSKMAAKCRVCPYLDTCDHKEMEALGFLTLPEAAVFPTMMGANVRLPDEAPRLRSTLL